MVRQTAVSPTPCGSKLYQLEAALDGVTLALTDEHLARLAVAG
ncbi:MULTISPECIES: hypothetical protein [unclassified Solwaraspora]|nr:hypothetical protein [Solwaraspora sp. WMMA2056]WJK41145.1 hypothetical protein O7608_01405 [Solwaraspora sp. WMMA2056]